MNLIRWVSSRIQSIKRSQAERRFVRNFVEGISGPTSESDKRVMELYGLLGKKTLSEEEKKRLWELGWRPKENRSDSGPQT